MKTQTRTFEKHGTLLVSYRSFSLTPVLRITLMSSRSGSAALFEYERAIDHAALSRERSTNAAAFARAASFI